MIPQYRQQDPVHDGTLEIDQAADDQFDVFFVPPAHRLQEAGLDPNGEHRHRAKLLEINSRELSLTIFPIKTYGNKDNFLQPKYRKIERIRLENFQSCDHGVDDAGSYSVAEILEILEDLPPAFTKTYAYGLGLAQPYRFIVDAVEKLTDCTEIAITNKPDTWLAPNERCLYISKKDFDRARLSMNNIGNRAQAAVRSVRGAAAHNIIAERIGLDPVEPTVGRHPHRKHFTAVAQGGNELSKDQQQVILNKVSSHAAELAEGDPEKFAKLRNDIELVTLEKLVQSYEAMLVKNSPEDDWQKFFSKNPFILNMAFGYPIIKVRDQASVGGRKLSGDGEKITDILVKNSLTNNIAIFEIKTPKTLVLNKKPYRDGIYTPSTILSGSINQVLDQKYQFQKQVAHIKENSRLYDIESYAIHCCLVIGKTPDGEDQKKSFELFRRNSKDVEIVTFDELLEKLKQLSLFLCTAE